MASVINLFTESARWFPDRAAFIQGLEPERRYSYREADRLMGEIAAGLKTHGIGKGDRIAFLTDPTVEHAIVYCSAFRVGAIPSSVHHHESPASIESMIEALDPEAVISQSEYLDTVDNLSGYDTYVLASLGTGTPGDTRYTDIGSVRGDDPVESAPETDTGDVASIHFTSGSTGEPKPIAHTHGELIECVQNGYLYGGQRNDTFLNLFSPSFIGWNNRVWTSIALGASIVFVEEWDPEDVLRVIESEGVSILKLVPTQWKRLLREDHGAYDLSSVRIAGYAGEPIDYETLERIRENISDDIISTYGTTEAMRLTALFPYEITEDNLNSIGKPLPTVEARIVEPGTGDPGSTVETGEVGELIFRSDTIAKGVWGGGETTERLLDDNGWWFSGDLASVDDDGFIFIEGRVDNMILSGGVNIYPERIEDVLMSHPDVSNCAVIGVPDETWGEAVKAYVVPGDDSMTESELRAWCENHESFGEYDRPKRIEFTASIPKTTTGKIDREALKG